MSAVLWFEALTGADLGSFYYDMNLVLQIIAGYRAEVNNILLYYLTVEHFLILNQCKWRTD